MIADKGYLEEISLWFRYKTPVWNSDDSVETEAIHNIMRVLRSIMGVERLAYVSIPITSGKFLYELMEQKPLMSESVMIKRSIEHNVQHNRAFARDVYSRRNCPVIYPGNLVPARQKWSQEHFQALWMSIIAELCTELHMAEGWEYSNGAAEELTHAFQLKLGIPTCNNLVFYNTTGSLELERERMKNIAVFDDSGRPITLEEGIGIVEGSLVWIESKGHRAERLIQCIKLMTKTLTAIERGFYQ